MFEFIKEWFEDFTSQFEKGEDKHWSEKDSVRPYVPDERYATCKREVTMWAKKYNLRPQEQVVLLNLLYSGGTRIEEYVDHNPRFDLNKKVNGLRDHGFIIDTLNLDGTPHTRGKAGKFKYIGSPER